MPEPASHGAQDDRFRLDILSASDLTEEVLAQLAVLFAGAYHNSHMHERLLADLIEPPEVFWMFLVRDLEDDGLVVGARAIQSMRHEFVDYLGFAPLHGKRFCVHPALRGLGLGQRIVAASNGVAFGDVGAAAVFGESNEVGAIAMHGRCGALIHVQSVVEHFPRNTSADARAYFAEFVTNPKLRGLRLPTGDGVQFAYCRDERVTSRFAEAGYVPAAEILNEAEGRW